MSCCKKKAKKAQLPTISLNYDLAMPIIGQGIVTHEIMHPGQIQKIVESAIDAGHRHFDSAPGPRETELGKAIHKKVHEKVITFKDIFVTSKLSNTYHDNVRECCESTLATLGVPYLHLYLIQSPCAVQGGGSLCPAEVGLVETWRQMEKLVDDRLVQAIGLANFNEQQIKRILAICTIKPALLQIESHIYFQNREIIQFCRSKSIAVSAFAPFASPGRADADKDAGHRILLEDPVVVKVAQNYGVAPAQIALRFLLQRGIPCITRGIHEAQQKQNLDVNNFHLSDEDMNTLNELETNERVVTLISLKNHPEYPFPDVLQREGDGKTAAALIAAAAAATEAAEKERAAEKEKAASAAAGEKGKEKKTT